MHPDKPLGVAFAVGGNPFWCAGDPELGARHAVAEAARNCAVVGARPWALTDCLNFGHPEDPEVMGDLEASLDGLAEAARALGGLASPGHPLPFVSGNVSLYNQVGKIAIPPSPIVMCAAVVRDVSTLLGQALRRAGHVLVLVGEPRDGLDGSAYRREILRERGGPPPALGLEHEARLQAFAVAVAEGRWACAAHDVSDGGLAVALAEMLLAAPPESQLGLEVNIDPFEVEAVVALFSERPAIVHEVSFERLPRLSQSAREHGLVAWPIGTVTAQPVMRALFSGSEQLTWDVQALREAAQSGLRKRWNEEGV